MIFSVSGHYIHPCQDDLVLKVDIEDVPFFNAPIYLENKQQIGKIDEIFGNIRDYYVSVRPSDEVKAKSFKVNDKVIKSFEAKLGISLWNLTFHL